MAAKRGNINEFVAQAAIKPLIDDSMKESARTLVDHIENCAEGSLSPSAPAKGEERASLDRALKRLRPAFDEISKWFIDPIKESKPSRANYGYEKLSELLAAAFVIGQCGTVTEGAKSFFMSENAKGKGRPEDPLNDDIKNILLRDGLDTSAEKIRHELRESRTQAFNQRVLRVKNRFRKN